jgi:hypothetical protein
LISNPLETIVGSPGEQLSIVWFSTRLRIFPPPFFVLRLLWARRNDGPSGTLEASAANKVTQEMIEVTDQKTKHKWGGVVVLAKDLLAGSGLAQAWTTARGALESLGGDDIA